MVIGKLETMVKTRLEAVIVFKAGLIGDEGLASPV